MNYDEIRALFHAFVLQPDNSLLSFSMSTDTRVLNTQPEQVYPQLQLDVPNWTPQMAAGIKSKKIIRTEVAIVCPRPSDDWQGQDSTMDLLEMEMERLLSFIDTKRRIAKWGQIDSIGTVVPIEFAEHAVLFGWAVPLAFKVDMPCYYNPTNIYNTVHLTAAFVDAGTELSLDIDGTVYTATWEDEKVPVDRPLDALLTSINQGTATHDVTARRHLDTLILSIDQPAVDVPWASAGDHTWTSITI